MVVGARTKAHRVCQHGGSCAQGGKTVRDLRRWRLASSLLTIVVLLSACVNRDQSASPSQSQTAGPIDPRRTTLNIGVVSEANSFDPQVNTAQVSAFRFYLNIYETLSRWGDENDLHS